jgi:hypothetical protein
VARFDAWDYLFVAIGVEQCASFFRVVQIRRNSISIYLKLNCDLALLLVAEQSCPVYELVKVNGGRSEVKKTDGVMFLAQRVLVPVSEHANFAICYDTGQLVRPRSVPEPVVQNCPQGRG